MPAIGTDSKVRVLDRPFLPALFGARFWDVAAGVHVQDGLLVQARSKRGQVVDAVQNRSGVWHFPRIPGINSFDVGQALLDGTSLAKFSRSVLVRVVDSARRFQTIEFEAAVPVEAGLFDWPHSPITTDDGSPLGTGPVPLFSRSSRPAPSGHLSIRAELWDVDANRAAAWALLEVSVAGPWGPLRFFGLADEGGAATVFLPVPFVPVDGVRMPAAARSWEVGVRVAYAPSVVEAPLGPSDGVAEPPRFDAILAQYHAPDAQIFVSRSPDVVLASSPWREPLRLIEPLILRTENIGLEPRLRSRLLIQTAP